MIGGDPAQAAGFWGRYYYKKPESALTLRRTAGGSPESVQNSALPGPGAWALMAGNRAAFGDGKQLGDIGGAEAELAVTKLAVALDFPLFGQNGVDFVQAD